MTATTLWSQAQAHAGDERTLAVVLQIRDGFHINPPEGQIPAAFDYLIPTRLQVKQAAEQLRPGPVRYPPPPLVTVNYSGKPEQIPAYHGQVVLYLPVAVAGDAAVGAYPLQLQLSYQACDAQQCLPPRSLNVETTLEIVPADVNVAPPAPAWALLQSPDEAATGGHATTQGAAQTQPAAAPTQPADDGGAIAMPPSPRGAGQVLSNTFLGWRFSLDAATAAGLALTLLVAFVAGLLLNFMPCVLPVIPIKILSLQRQAGSKGRMRLLGLVYAGGIVFCFLALGALVAGLVGGLQRQEWGQIFSRPAVSLVLAAIIIAMAVGMLGLYSIRLPQKLYFFQFGHDTVLGNFLLGAFTAILSTPCTGPMLGATIAWAVRQPAALTLLAFATMGAGMAFPYLLLTANPRWVERLPRTGPGSELIKQVLGLLLLAVAAFFLGPILPGAGRWWLIAILTVAAMAWLIWRTWRITRRLGARLSITVGALLLALAAVALAGQLSRPGLIPWQDFSAQSFADAQAQGKTILIEFTADWCGNCKALELTTYRDSRLAGFFANGQTVAFQVDLTHESNREGWALQEQISGGGGIPLAAVYHAGRPQPAAVLQGIFSAEQLLQALQDTP